MSIEPRPFHGVMAMGFTTGMPNWSGYVAKDIEPLEIQEWIDGLSKGLRSKLRNMMSAVYNHVQKFGMIPRSEGSNP
jgi:hypothetical protein